MTRMRTNAVDFHSDTNYLKLEGCLGRHFPNLGKGMKLSKLAKKDPIQLIEQVQRDDLTGIS